MVWNLKPYDCLHSLPLVLTEGLGEIYNTTANNWTLVAGAPVAPMLVGLPLPNTYQSDTL